jgi:hypothetical protein
MPGWVRVRVRARVRFRARDRAGGIGWVWVWARVRVRFRARAGGIGRFVSAHRRHHALPLSRISMSSMMFRIRTLNPYALLVSP